MTNNPKFRVTRTSWEHDGERLRGIRRLVFVEEQGISEQLEWDGLDETATHFIAEMPDGIAVATARLLDSGQIGRMAVLPAQRRNGIGAMLLKDILETARDRGIRELFLHAQVSVIPFYLRHGFKTVGEVFEEAGIRHQTMRITVQ